MLQYKYLFEKDGKKYYVYAPFKTKAIELYLRWNDLKALPKGTTITRTNI